MKELLHRETDHNNINIGTLNEQLYYIDHISNYLNTTT